MPVSGIFNLDETYSDLANPPQIDWSSYIMHITDSYQVHCRFHLTQ